MEDRPWNFKSSHGEIPESGRQYPGLLPLHAVLWFRRRAFDVARQFIRLHKRFTEHRDCRPAASIDRHLCLNRFPLRSGDRGRHERTTAFHPDRQDLTWAVVAKVLWIV